MERTGEVTSVQGEWLEITFCRPADCEKCHACSGSQKTISLRIRGMAKTGDMAVVRLPEKTVAKASLLAYALPLAGLFLGMSAGQALLPGAGSLGAILGGLVGLAAAAGIIFLTEKKRAADPRWAAQIVRVIPRGNENI